MSNIIDRKFQLLAINPVKGTVYTEKNALVLCAKDKAVVPALEAYLEACKQLGCDHNHLDSVSLLIDRVKGYQLLHYHGGRIPDTALPGEIERCVYGIGVD